MIQFDFNWSDPLNLVILALAFGLLPLLLWLTFLRNKVDVSAPRRWIGVGLNVLLWLAVMAFIIQPYLITEAKSVTGFLIGKDVPAGRANALKDSIANAKKVVSADFKNTDFDTLILAGQDFQPEMLMEISVAQTTPVQVQWIPYFADNQLQSLHWKGVVRKGEMQVIRGNVTSSKEQVLRITYGNQTLDSTVLKPGQNQFRTQFPVFSEGRTAVELVMDDHVQDTLRFFARPAQKLTFQFILDNPDFESRALANRLGKSGHSVIYAATLSKDVRSRETINEAKEPDVILTHAGNAGNKLVKKSLMAGKSVLFINVTNPAAEIKAINAALGTRFALDKITGKDAIPVKSGLTALPFRFSQSNRYFTSRAFPVAVEKARGKVGVSLLNETFPLQLTGDSATYQSVWDAVLAPVLPVIGNNVEVEAPLLEGIHADIALNGFSKMPEFLKVGSDTLFTKTSSLNNKSATIRFKPTESGWLRSDDSLNMEVYVENRKTENRVSQTARLIDFIKSHNHLQTKLKNKSALSSHHERGVRKELSDWMWFSLLMGCFLTVWIERKL
ncbi:hypothetical protein LXM25_22600 [Dyadobacter sp. LJ53]|uniref:hypothetical protein n=1 Tax=Dyadobacter chenwenxiniae TaxID=2906456 RepID=UPI001F2A3550|nr:hypothetical protein [Dyadobacter chenwenxiniae]MCF0052879.1 hypothetical protein [Dyadobacter chenwenxiniae]